MVNNRFPTIIAGAGSSRAFERLGAPRRHAPQMLRSSASRCEAALGPSRRLGAVAETENGAHTPSRLSRSSNPAPGEFKFAGKGSTSARRFSLERAPRRHGMSWRPFPQEPVSLHAVTIFFVRPCAFPRMGRDRAFPTREENRKGRELYGKLSLSRNSQYATQKTRNQAPKVSS
jgi:hypothetical protein